MYVISTLKANDPIIMFTGSECRRHKIKCDMKPGETSCAKCQRSGTECVPYDMSRQFMDQDAA